MKHWLKVLLSAALAVFIVGSSVSCSNVHETDAENYIKADAIVKDRVGDVRSLTLTNTIIVGVGDQTQPYREYQFIVRGSRGKALRSLQIRNADDPETKKFFIKSIDGW